VRKLDSPLTSVVYFTGTSADSIDGNSGGPAFDDMGNLVGVLIGSTNISDDRYVGSDTKGSKAAHSVITPCYSTKDFVNKAWTRYLMTKNDALE
jgi:S1-C subfamily serine protease